ncbi:MAG: alanine--glyoxylate aminotransferase family protein [Acidobacteriales bacterium]|nr:alanine--glyoxylate aminotransferase family protein [Candidatus Koribacter versatilis]MBI3644942.1 alanine--glyoxylate aminotransferase family protein [Terriglobales bacterium]
MLRKNRLFTPGPTPLLPSAQTAMASYGAHHRTADFRALFTRVLTDLKEFIGTQNDVLVLTASGTGFMEASVSNLTSPGDKVLVLTAGKFGERWVSVAKAFGCDVKTVTAPYGETLSMDDVRKHLTPEIRCVYLQATESSTGVRHDVEAVAKLVRALPDPLLVVDAITGLGTTHFDVDGWGVDVIIGGSQKALMIPPGLAYGAISERAWQRMETTKSPRYYFDLRKERKAAAKAETAYTPATAMFAGLAAALDYVRQMGDGNLAAGRKALVENAELCAAMTRAGVQALGLKLFAAQSPAAALTAVAAPLAADSTTICKRFRDQFGAVVANGQAEMKGQLFRIAHIGYYDYLDTIGVLAALEHVIAEVTGKAVEFGCAVRAAQEAVVRSSEFGVRKGGGS